MMDSVHLVDNLPHDTLIVMHIHVLLKWQNNYLFIPIYVYNAYSMAAVDA